VKLHKFVGIKLGSLEQFDLSDEYVLKGVNSLSFVLNLLSNRLRDKFLYKFLKIASSGNSSHNVHHFLSDGSDLRCLSVGGLLDLVGSSLGESNREHSKEVSVGGLDIDVSFNQSLPLLDERSKLIGCKIHSVEVCEDS